MEIREDKMTEIILDKGENDLAYVLYDKRVTEGNVAPAPFRLAKQVEIKQGVRVKTLGYPLAEQADTPFPRMSSFDCEMTGKSGYLPPKPQDPGYEGLLHETTCMAWFGNSGGLFFRTEGEGESSKIILYGVLTHTFDILEDGDVDPGKVQEDKYGKFAIISNFSPLSSAKSLEKALKKADATE